MYQLENSEILLIAAVAFLGIVGMVYSTGAVVAPIGVDPAYLVLGESVADACIEMEPETHSDWDHCCSLLCEDSCENAGEGCLQHCRWSCEDALDKAYMLSP